MNTEDIRRVFFPFADDCTVRVKNSRRRFVYYTSADTAYKVIANSEIWMRSTSTMNDFMEVEHGMDCLKQGLDTDAGKRLTTALDAIYPGVSDEATKSFNAWLPGIRADTFITCLSEHLDSEDTNGRLSMWRAYGRNCGVALVLNSDVMFMESPEIGVFASPVAYHSTEEVILELDKVASRISTEAELVKKLSREQVLATIFAVFRFAVLCTKHPGFWEEREWRVIASPSMNTSPVLEAAVEIVGGVPQIVQKIRLVDLPGKGISGLALSSLLNRVIIGPCENPHVVWRAFSTLLQSKGLADAGVTAYTSQIPLRM